MDKSQNILLVGDKSEQFNQLLVSSESLGYKPNHVSSSDEAVKYLSSDFESVAVIIYPFEAGNFKTHEAILQFIEGKQGFKPAIVLLAKDFNSDLDLLDWGKYSFEILKSSSSSKEFEIVLKRISAGSSSGDGNLQSELDEVKEKYNQLSLSHEEEERLSTLGLMGSAIGHDLSSPISIVNMCVSQIETYSEEDTPGEKYRLLTGKIEKAMGRVVDIVEHMKSFAHPQEVLVDRELELLVPMIELAMSKVEMPEGQKISFSVNPKISLKTNKKGMLKVFFELFKNAVDANDVKGGGELKIKSEEADGQVSLYISDEGGGIPEEDLYNILKPFYKLQEYTHGKGLGLTLASKYCKTMGINFEIYNEDKGTTVKMSWSNDEQ